MVQNKLEVYKCQVCGNMVEVLQVGGGALVCCGQEMTLLKENSTDAAVEKHVPVIERLANGIKIKVGSVEHPMVKEHFIQWVEVIAQGKACRHFFNPGEKPEAVFGITPNKLTAREYCNLHGLWKSEA